MESHARIHTSATNPNMRWDIALYKCDEKLFTVVANFKFPNLQVSITNKCLNNIFYRPQRSCGQGYVFTRVCDLFTGGAREIPWAGRTPLPTQGADPTLGADPPWAGRTPQAGRIPPGRENPPGADPTLQSRHPPYGKHTPAYGQRAAGTHPTGMHSCCHLKFLC